MQPFIQGHSCKAKGENVLQEERQRNVLALCQSVSEGWLVYHQIS